MLPLRGPTQKMVLDGSASSLWLAQCLLVVRHAKVSHQITQQDFNRASISYLE